MDLKQALDEVCRRYGLLMSLVVEEALREKIEDLVDTHDLEEAQRTAVGFLDWADVERVRIFKIGDRKSVYR